MTFSDKVANAIDRTPATDPVTNPTPTDIAAAQLDSLSEIKLGRVGHYSFQSTCQEASIVHVNDDGTVNLRGHDHSGDPFSRIDVLVSLSPDPDDGATAEARGMATFHLNRDCPWGR